MPEGIYFSPDNGERIARAVRAVEGGSELILPRPRQLLARDVVPVPFRNDYAGTIPHGGVCEVAEPVTLDATQAYPVTRPTTTFKRLYLVNTGEDVPDDGYGWGSWLLGHADEVLYDDADTPAIGETWGPQSGSFELKKYRHGFNIWGNPTGGSTDLVIAQQCWDREILIKNDTGSAIAVNSSGTFKIFTGAAGSEADSGQTLTAYNKTSVSFANGKFGSAAYIHGQWYAVPWQV